MSIPRDATLSSLRGCSRGERRRIVNVPLRTREAVPEGNGAKNQLPKTNCQKPIAKSQLPKATCQNGWAPPAGPMTARIQKIAGNDAHPHISKHGKDLAFRQTHFFLVEEK